MERREEGREEEEEEEEKRLFSGGRLDHDDAADLRDELLATAQMEKQQAEAEEEEAEEDHGEEEPFEIVDYTLASPFEKFVARIENTLVKWKLSLHAYSNGERPTQGANASTPGETMLTVREVFQYDSINYQLMYQFAETEQAKREGELSSLSPTRGSADGDRSEHALPEALQAILDGGKDFPSRAHHLQRWFGVKDFLILAPISEMGATNNQANHLLSAIAIAIQETQCPIPIFVPKDERWKGIYVGYMAHPPSNTSVRWECNMRHTAPSPWQTASPILKRFAQQFQPESAFAREENGFLEEELSNTQRERRKMEEDICFAARHTYMRGDWEHNAWRKDLMERMRNRNRKVYRQANNNKANKTKPLEGFWESELLWGTTKDPIDAMHLAVTWESAPVVQVLSQRESLHNKKFLTPGASSVEGVVVKTEPKWSLRCIYKKNNVYFLSESLESFLSAYVESKKWISMHNLLLSVPKGRPTNEIEGEARVLYAMESIGRSLAASLQSAAHFPTAQEIDSMLQYLFDPEKEFSEVTSTKQTNEERYFPSYSQPIVELLRSLKSAPPGSLLSSLSSCLLSLEGLNAIAVVWNEFVKECRWHWDNLKFIPRIERQRMNYSTCLLYQKLQLINYCIERKLALGEKSNAEIEQELKAAARYNEDLQQSEDNPQQEQTVITSRFAFTEDELVEEEEEEEEEEEGDKGWDIGLEDDEAAETNGWDDAEIELPDDPSSQEETDTSNGNSNEATSNSQQGRKGAKELFIISSVPSEEQEANEKKPEENKKNRTERLLASGEEMWVPFTQPHGWMTEDMLEEQEKIFEELGSSIEAQQIRAKMQSASLLSDMEAFKAANPGCILEDFVRWYSPSDWIVESKEQMLADYARKKQERKQRKEEEDTKMKEDKQEENENALEEKEGQLEKEEEIKLPNYFEFEENGKTMVGYLSTRMQMANNLWLQTWQEAKAVPITSQKLLFDHNKEAEKALHYLETLSPFSFMQQMVGVGLSCAYSSLCRLPCAVHIAPVKEALESLRQLLRSIDTSAITTTVQTQLLQIITQTEQLCAAATSLLHKLPNQNEVVGRLMANMMNTNIAAADEVVLSRGDALTQAKSLFLYHHHTNTHSFGREERQQRAPQAKEYILRSMVPSPLSFSLPQRLYVLVTHSECRVASVVSHK